MDVSIIAAVAENGVIGRGGHLPWRLSDDLRRFKELTMGHTVVMGRKTWESIGRPLQGRRMIVITRHAGYQAVGAQIASSLEDALRIAEKTDDDEAFVIGGAEVYRLALPRADRLYMTRVHAHVEGDTCLPDFELTNWQLVGSERHDADEKNEYPFSFEEYQRVR